MKRFPFVLVIVWFVAVAACSEGSSPRSASTSGGGATSVGTGGTVGGGGVMGSGGVPAAGGTGTGATTGATSGGGGAGAGGSLGGAGTAAGGSDAGASAGAGGARDAGPECVAGMGITDIDANTARDNKTCLVWQKMPTCSGAFKTVAQCCQDLTQGGFDDWRMPTVAELFTWAKPATNAEYMTCPAYVKPGAGDPANNFEFCTVTTYSAVTCAHRGQATTSGTFCVRAHGQNVAPVTTETACSSPCGLSSEIVYQDCAP